MGMKWLELAVYTTDAGIDAVSAALTGVFPNAGWFPHTGCCICARLSARK